MEARVCGACNGRGRVRCGDTLTRDGLHNASCGAWISCTVCQGRKVVAAAIERGLRGGYEPARPQM